MKYKELPSKIIVEKATATSFETPSKNRKVLDWGDDVLGHIRFVEHERIKLIKRYGNDDGNGNLKVPKEKLNEFAEKFKEVLETDIENYIPCPIERDWFHDEVCTYPEEKKLWISAAEISRLCKK